LAKELPRYDGQLCYESSETWHSNFLSIRIRFCFAVLALNPAQHLFESLELELVHRAIMTAREARGLWYVLE